MASVDRSYFYDGDRINAIDILRSLQPRLPLKGFKRIDTARVVDIKARYRPPRVKRTGPDRVDIEIHVNDIHQAVRNWIFAHMPPVHEPKAFKTRLGVLEVNIWALDSEEAGIEAYSNGELKKWMHYTDKQVNRGRIFMKCQNRYSTNKQPSPRRRVTFCRCIRTMPSGERVMLPAVKMVDLSPLDPWIKPRPFVKTEETESDGSRERSATVESDDSDLTILDSDMFDSDMFESDEDASTAEPEDGTTLGDAAETPLTAADSPASPIGVKKEESATVEPEERSIEVKMEEED
ncbi:hypothetical protein OQA88_8708 [Cercophora sp. LCS_1]